MILFKQRGIRDKGSNVFCFFIY
uniref:Uncharacterized protein n=1 Tax=Arundo donax TaxID=35708 RepID=A0A0A9CEI2_ARUDO